MTGQDRTPTGDRNRPDPSGTRHPCVLTSADHLTVGVEEEFLLVDPVPRTPIPKAPQVVAEAALELGDRVGTELTQFQVEVRSDPHTRLADLGDQLRATRKSVVRAAARHGARVVSTGLPVLGHSAAPPLTDEPRYIESGARFRALNTQQSSSACACHLHVGVEDPARAVQVCNHVRPWLPLLLSIAANSPYCDGGDTGYASWRTMAWARWPVAGPPPYFESLAHFDELADRLAATGAVLGRAGLYWDVRPSHHHPTVEVRIADAAATVDDVLLLAALTRALIARALQAIDHAEPVARPDQETLRAACWRAARDGLSGPSIDPSTGNELPVAARMDALMTWLHPALDRHGDIELVRNSWPLEHGNGADRQRAAYRRRKSFIDVVDLLTL